MGGKSACMSSPLLLLLFFTAVAACSSSIYGWQVRTNSTELPASFYPRTLGQQPIALFPAITMAGLRGNEVGLAHYFGQVLQKAAPNWKVLSEQETSTESIAKAWPQTLPA